MEGFLELFGFGEEGVDAGLKLAALGALALKEELEVVRAGAGG